MKKIFLVLMCGVALLGCDGFVDLSSGPLIADADSTIDVSNIQLSEDSPLQDMGDYYLLGDDIIIDKNDPLTAELIYQLSGSAPVNNARSFRILNNLMGGKKWTNGIVPFYWDESIAAFTEHEKNKVRGAMTTISMYCNVEFIETVNSGYRIIKDPTLEFANGKSTLGMVTNARVSIRTFSFRVITHELMHGLGFSHEHQRPDRDQHISYPNHPGYTQNASLRIIKGFPVEYLTPYDHQSIMHYSKEYHNLDFVGKRNGVIDKTINVGNYRLSAGDIAGLQKLYGKRKVNGNLLFRELMARTKYDLPQELTLHMNDKGLSFDGVYWYGDKSNFDGYIYTPKSDKVHGFFDLDGDGIKELLISSDSQIGVLGATYDYTRQKPSRVYAKFVRNHGEWLSGWYFSGTTDEIVAIEDFDGDQSNGKEILIRSPWGIGILQYKDGKMWTILAKSYSTTFQGGWKLSHNDEFVAFGNITNSGDATEMVVRTNTGFSIVRYNGMNNLQYMTGEDFGNWLHHWCLGSNDIVHGVGNFDGHDGDEILITSKWGMGILKYSSSDRVLKSIMCQPLTRISRGEFNVYLSYDDLSTVNLPTGSLPLRNGINEVLAIHDFDKDGVDEILMGQLQYNSHYLGLEDYLYSYSAGNIHQESWRNFMYSDFNIYHDDVVNVQYWKNDSTPKLVVSHKNRGGSEHTSFANTVYEYIGGQFRIKETFSF